MSKDSLRAIESARLAGACLVSPIAAWEIGVLVARKRIKLSMEPTVWFDQVLAQPGVGLADLSPEILIASSFLPGQPPNDPADRIIIATARAHGLTVISRDGEIIPYGRDQGFVNVLVC